ncbi:hypothetical protein [Microbacterium sp.]|uniref:hypothetical protein n=1 Tax=Microbacterium sp. TaxID=51671 RepID=UPI003A8E6253
MLPAAERRDGGAAGSGLCLRERPVDVQRARVDEQLLFEHTAQFINKTGRDDGIRVEAGVLAGPRAGVSYALIVCFDDLSIMHRLRAHEAFRTLGVELMEYVY